MEFLRKRAFTCVLLILVALIQGWAQPAGAFVTFDWVEIGDAGNPPDPLTGRGAVSHEFRISRHRVTSAQYCAFLEATLQGSGQSCGGPGGSPGPGQSGVSRLSALRFANWLHNGQPTGPIGANTTEDGAYTIPPNLQEPIARNPGALFFVPNDDETYKAMFFAPATQTYHLWAGGSDVPLADYTGVQSDYGTVEHGLSGNAPALECQDDGTCRFAGGSPRPSLPNNGVFSVYDKTTRSLLNEGSNTFRVGAAPVAPAPAAGLPARLLLCAAFVSLAGAWRAAHPGP